VTRTFIIVGASSGVGRAIALEFAKNGNNLILTSRDEEDLKAITSDLSLRYPTGIFTALRLDAAFTDSACKYIENALDIYKDTFAGILFPMGMIGECDILGQEGKLTDQLIDVNLIAIAKMVNLVMNRANIFGPISIVGFGSVAGVRGRNGNLSYSCAKAALELFFEGLAHGSNKLNIYTQFYILGYMETNLAFGKKLLFKAGSTQKLAKLVYSNLNIKFIRCYFPGKWRYIVCLLKMLPWKIYKNLNF
jgi:short-subunit dehydrogenase